MATLYVCDRCGNKAIKRVWVRLTNPERLGSRGTTTVLNTTGTDLCLSCLTEFKKFLEPKDKKK